MFKIFKRSLRRSPNKSSSPEIQVMKSGVRAVVHGKVSDNESEASSLPSYPPDDSESDDAANSLGWTRPTPAAKASLKTLSQTPAPCFTTKSMKSQRNPKAEKRKKSMKKMKTVKTPMKVQTRWKSLTVDPEPADKSLIQKLHKVFASYLQTEGRLQVTDGGETAVVKKKVEHGKILYQIKSSSTIWGQTTEGVFWCCGVRGR